MILVIYGYCINDIIEFRLTPPVLVNTLNGTSLRLRATKARLLTFLLNRASEAIILDDDIMTSVFEDYGLRCSKARLWQAIYSLESLLLSSGIKNDIFTRIQAKGYSLHKLRVRTLFYSEDA